MTVDSQAWIHALKMMLVPEPDGLVDIEREALRYNGTRCHYRSSVYTGGNVDNSKISLSIDGLGGLLHSQQDRNWHKLSDVYIWIVLVVVVPTEEGTEELRTESTSTVYSSVVHITETVVHSNSYC
ncbi:hypothetical protein F2P81_010259 [Scophthalmus maximus]|uniref:Uncharacterized protein n=1 Tax=Scophthalmus maximus TaxID=52904 RepID=A0A6A4SXC4_SCOMX|nr:hypothetical protein F2P81_010259 [Scophthalmus maximus]